MESAGVATVLAPTLVDHLVPVAPSIGQNRGLVPCRQDGRLQSRDIRVGIDAGVNGLVEGRLFVRNVRRVMSV